MLITGKDTDPAGESSITDDSYPVKSLRNIRCFGHTMPSKVQLFLKNSNKSIYTIQFNIRKLAIQYMTQL